MVANPVRTQIPQMNTDKGIREIRVHPCPVTSNIRWLYASTASFGVIQAGAMAYLPVFLARLGASAFEIGLLTAAPALVSVAILIPSGLLAERFRDQVRLRVWTEIAIYIPTLILALCPFFVPLPALPAVAIVLSALQALPMALETSAFLTVFAQAFPPERIARINGVRWALMGLTGAVSVAAFGRLLDLVAFPLNYQIVFAVTWVAGLGNALFFTRMRVPLLERRSGPAAPARGAVGAAVAARLAAYVRSVVEQRAFVRYLLATLAFRVALMMPEALFSLVWVRSLQASDSLIGLRGTAVFAAQLIGFLSWGRLANRLGHRPMLFASAFLAGFYPICTGLAPTAAWLIPIGAIWGLAYSGIRIALFDMLIMSVPAERMPRLSSLYSLAERLSMFAGPLLGVALSQATSLRSALLWIGVIQLVAATAFFLLPRRQRGEHGASP